MKIILASPLYPPDIAPPAPYVKELARRLAGTNDVTIVTYGRLPEEVPGARIVATDKRRPLPVRLVQYTYALVRAARDADALYIQNGPSVELPVAAALLFVRTPLFIRVGDKAAHAYAQSRPLRRALERFVLRRAHIVEGGPAYRPEILPFSPRPEAALAAWEESWARHTADLTRLFSHAS